jgi:hypothetical protein
VNNPIRNETSLVLVVAVIFSAVAIPVLSGFLEPSKPPAVAAVQIGDPRERGGAAGTAESEAAPAPDTERQRQASSPTRKRRAPTQRAPAQPAPSPPADDGDDDAGEAD